jgi:predicted  nucleic acid-binding Zn-ribbon protein
MKTINFSNAVVISDVKTDVKENVKDIEEAPPILSKSKSTNGLSSLTKSIIEHETKQNEMNDILENMREIVKKYQDELVNLKAMLQAQTEIIKCQEDCLSEYEEELKKTKEEIKLIWET